MLSDSNIINGSFARRTIFLSPLPLVPSASRVPDSSLFRWSSNQSFLPGPYEVAVCQGIDTTATRVLLQIWGRKGDCGSVGPRHKQNLRIRGENPTDGSIRPEKWVGIEYWWEPTRGFVSQEPGRYSRGLGSQYLAVPPHCIRSLTCTPSLQAAVGRVVTRLARH